MFRSLQFFPKYSTLNIQYSQPFSNRAFSDAYHSSISKYLVVYAMGVCSFYFLNNCKASGKEKSDSTQKNLSSKLSQFEFLKDIQAKVSIEPSVLVKNIILKLVNYAWHPNKLVKNNDKHLYNSKVNYHFITISISG